MEQHSTFFMSLCWQYRIAAVIFIAVGLYRDAGSCKITRKASPAKICFVLHIFAGEAFFFYSIGKTNKANSLAGRMRTDAERN